MDQVFEYKDVTYSEPALGWVNGIYYPRKAQCGKGSRFEQSQGGWLKVHSRVWQEIEETGYGVYYYEETTHFTTTLPGCNYEVAVTFVNPTEAPYICHVRLNGVVKQDGVTVAPGEEQSIVFMACMIDGSFELSFPIGNMADIHGEEMSGDVYIKDIKIAPLPAKEKREKPHLFLISDSTVQTYGERSYPQTGWGQVLCRFFQGFPQCSTYRAKWGNQGLGTIYELPGLVIENRAIAGRSARSFYDDGRLDHIMGDLCPGDFMFVQFAHNDNNALRPNRYVAPEEFPQFLQRYLDACERRGAQCVFVTPVTMMGQGEDGKFQIAFNNYREKMMELAGQRNVPLLDLGERSTAYLNEIGVEESKQIYLWAEEGEYPDGAYAAGVSDRAHLQEYGALVYANMVMKLIVESGDDRLNILKALARPREVSQIEKPKKRGAAVSSGEKSDTITGFVVQEISTEDGRHGMGSFLLNWNQQEGALSYFVYARKKGEPEFQKVKNVTRAEKEAYATLPFSAESGCVWEYYVTAVFGDGREGKASRVVEVDLR